MDTTTLEELVDAVATGRTIVYFYATICPSCKSIGGYFDESSKQCENKQLAFKKCNITNVEGASEKYSIRSVPTIVSFVNGVATKRFTGGYRDMLDDMIEKNIKMLNTVS
ncbi:Thioredoxin [Entamoeba marina]